MERPRLVGSLGALLVVSALGAACSPLAEGPPRPDKSAPAQVSARRAAITAQQAVTAAQNGLNFVLSDAYSWISANGCAACHRGGLPVFAGALSVKNGLSVNRSQLDFLATKAATEQLQWGDNFWKHDPTYELRFNKGSFEAWGLAGYIAYSGNTSAMNQMKGAWDWLIGQTNNGAYNPAATSAAYYNAAYYTGTKWNYTFPNDGKSFAGQTRKFIPGDYQAPPVTYNWAQPTGLIVAAMSLWLNTNQGLAAADRTTYTNYMNNLTDALEGGYARAAGSWTLSELFYGLNGLIAAGRGPAVNGNAAAMRDEILSRKIAGNAGWADPVVGYATSSPGATGEALYALCQAGVRLDQNAAVNDAINWLAGTQNANGSWSYGSFTVDVPTSYALLGLSCYGVLNVNVSTSGVTPADPNNAGAAQISPGIAGTQTVTFNLNVQNQGYVTNSFTFSASGGFAGTTFSFNPATLTVNANATGTTQVRATFPANLQAGLSAPVSVVTTYVAAGGTTSTSKSVTVNVGNVANPGAGALVTSTAWQAGNGASVQVGANLTLSVKALQGATAINAGSVTFFVGGQAIGTVAPSGGLFSITWPVPNNITGNASIQANFAGAVVGATSYAASSASGNVTITLPPPPPAPGISGPANGYTSTNPVVNVTGTSQAGAILTVKSSAGANLGTITVPAGGAFSVPLNLAPGVYTITAIATNAGGNSPTSSAVTITINPPAPVVSNPVNNYTSANTLIIISGTGYPGAAVMGRNNTNVAALGPWNVDAAGNWSGGVNFALGAQQLQFTQTIGGAFSALVLVNINMLAPAPAITSPANNAALPNGNNVVSGTGTVGTTITVYDNGVNTGVTGVVAANGQYNITIALGFGSHVLTTTATNNAGASAQSAGRTVSVAPGAPVITSPAAASSDSIGPFTFAGTGVVGATVRIYDNGVEINSQVIAANGTFSYTVNAPALGAHNLTATQTASGQTSPASAARTITVHNDSDGDTIYDEIDNCVALWNKDQVDRDADGVGDVCDKAPGQTDASNNTTSATDASLTTDPSADTNLLAANQNNLLNLPAGAWATRSTLTLVNIPANNSGNIEIWGRASPSVAAWTKMTSYDAQLGPSHPVTLAGGLAADVAVTTPRTSLANYANRYKQFQVRVKEADGSVTTIPHCASGTTVSAVDDRCVNSAIAYTLVDGTNVDAGIKLIFKVKAF